jgi:hypothetical protein
MINKKLTVAALMSKLRMQEKELNQYRDADTFLRERNREKKAKLLECEEYIKWAVARLKFKDSVIVSLAGQLHDYMRCEELDNDPAPPIIQHFDPSN